jgi:hypothetical protein
VGMKIKLSAHGAYHHQYHVVWIPKYRKKVLKGERKQYLEKGLFDIETFHPDIAIETLSIQVDHIHLVIVIPPKYAVSAIVSTSHPLPLAFSSETFSGIPHVTYHLVEDSMTVIMLWFSCLLVNLQMTPLSWRFSASNNIGVIVAQCRGYRCPMSGLSLPELYFHFF